jgi:sucrose-6-phosphate hydrolase SacC (GH32 family)
VLYGAVREAAAAGSAERRFLRSAYMVGSFDGKKFTPETEFLKGFSGPNFYAAQTFANAPDDRRVLMAWLQSAVYPGMPFTQGVTLPTELTLRRTPQGLRVFFNPVRELEQLRTKTFADKNLSQPEANALLKKADGELLDLDIDLSTETTNVVNLHIRGNTIVWRPDTGTLSCRGTSVSLAPAKSLHLRVVIDRCVLEVYPDRGVTGLTFGGNLFSNSDPLKLDSEKPIAIPNIRISQLRSAWK